jgi:zinc protease
MPGKGPFMISFSTKTSHAKDAIKVTRDLLSTFINEGPAPEELNAAKAYLSGSFPLSLASNRSIANMLIKIAFYHLPDDFLTSYIEHINAVSIDDIKTSFKKHLTPSKLIQVSVGKTDS